MITARRVQRQNRSVGGRRPAATSSSRISSSATLVGGSSGTSGSSSQPAPFHAAGALTAQILDQSPWRRPPDRRRTARPLPPALPVTELSALRAWRPREPLPALHASAKECRRDTGKSLRLARLGEWRHP